MITGIPFQTKARTVDHLGREQIADTPTAISELWKNAFDAYARHVALDLFDGEQKVAVICDDGHGMSRDEFINRWLVVGTESKATTDSTPIDDRNGLFQRPKQGQKGIGRLSCANLGPVLLLVSRRRNRPFVAALIDWRLFENPYLNLSDIQIPVVEFENKWDIFGLLPQLRDGIGRNLRDADDERRDDRLRSAWDNFDALYDAELKAGTTNRLRPPSEDLQETAHTLEFSERHLSKWPVWSGEAEHGTALMISGLNYDLLVELDTGIADPSARATRDRFFETLSSFVDPFIDPRNPNEKSESVDFEYTVRAWHGAVPEVIVGSEKQFDRTQLEGLEHQISGTVDRDGVFTGRIKAFGKWLDETVRINPPDDLVISHRADSMVGPFDVYIASMEFVSANSTLPEEQFHFYTELAKKYSGFMVFRDGLRVLPYGRTDNDFFDIESRRTKNAGREFWNHRQMFGRLAITREHNPNLKDKAGREGLLDNRAAKTLKDLVSNILMTTARRFFGSASAARKEVLPQIKDDRRAIKAKEEREKLRKRLRKEFRTKLENSARALPQVVSEIRNFVESLEIVTEREIGDAQATVDEFRYRIAELRLPDAPNPLGSLEGKFGDYQREMRAAGQLIEKAAEEIDQQIERIDPEQPRDLLTAQIARHSAQIALRIRSWQEEIGSLQRAEFERVRELVSQRSKVFEDEALPILAVFDRGEISLAEASKRIELEKWRTDADNQDIFFPYIAALESLKESIDLENLAAFGMDEANEMRAELDRLNSLAQLGIAVEIVGHELQAYDDILGSGLRRLPAEVRESAPAKDIEFAYEGLTDQLRFLSPLRLAGQKIQRWITGGEIADYVGDFFKLQLANNRIELIATNSFRKLRIFDQQSRLYPVFINLLNNSIYWIATSGREDRRIILDVVDGEVVIADSGPGVSPEDADQLFGLFFTRKVRGGRGVGLYLSRANLAAGGHRIRYEPPSEKWPLRGAVFVIDFRGAEFDGA